ncbi:MAG: hypothetical protein HY821_23335 [Acidobacteria bacterium]|nr:hypothetical protein [Acidobacteriota bacterium]
MNICLVSQEYPPEAPGGGIGAQTYAKAHGLVARGHQFTVISSSPSPLRTITRDGAVDLIHIPDWKIDSFMRLAGLSGWLFDTTD